jgi:dCTP deaminase
MPMLSDKDLAELARSKSLITPFNEEYCAGATIDLTLDALVRKRISDEPVVIGVEETDDMYQAFDLSKGEFWLNPGEYVLVQTVEKITVPTNMIALIFERQSVKLLGLSVSSASYMNPGYRGHLTIPVVNNSNARIKLTPGVQFCQLGLFELSSESEKPYDKQDGKYMDETGVSISKLHLDKGIQEFLRLKGIQRASEETVKDLGDYLMNNIRKSAVGLADILRKEFGEPQSE